MSHYTRPFSSFSAIFARSRSKLSSFASLFGALAIVLGHILTAHSVLAQAGLPAAPEYPPDELPSPNDVSFPVPEMSVERDIEVLTQDRQKAAEFAPDLREAWQAHRSGNSPRAKELFMKPIEAGNSTDAEKVQGMFGMAVASSFGNPAMPEEAKTWLNRIIKEFPDNPVVPWAYLELGRLATDEEGHDSKNAMALFEKVINEFPDSPAIHEAALRMATNEFYDLDPAGPERGKRILEEHLEAYPTNPLAPVMHFRLLYWLQEVDRDYDKGLKHSVILGHMMMSDSGRWGQHLWNTAQVYRLRHNNPREALKWYKRLVAMAPRDRMVGDAKQMIKEIEEQLAAEEQAQSAPAAPEPPGAPPSTATSPDDSVSGAGAGSESTGMANGDN